VSIRYVELADYLAIAAEITGLDPATLTRVAKLGLAESALHAPSAGFGETEFYPGLFADNCHIGAAGFEPTISRPQIVRDTKLRHAPSVTRVYRHS
jgi:hypothetical protein